MMTTMKNRNHPARPSTEKESSRRSTSSSIPARPIDAETVPLASLGASRPAVPTEGQLRWAQFHHHRRARRLQAALVQFWQTPATVHQVEGALSDDGRSSVHSSPDEAEASSTRMKRRSKKPLISRGRRALLRVSQRKLEQRRREAGHLRGRFGEQGENEHDPLNDSDEDGEEDDVLAAIFAEESFLRKQRRRRRRQRGHHTTTDDEERIQRFEAAFMAMMMSLAAAQPSAPRQEAMSGKRWTRPEQAQTLPSVDGRHYLDLKWGLVSREHTALRNPHLRGYYALPPAGESKEEGDGQEAGGGGSTPQSDHSQKENFPTDWTVMDGGATTSKSQTENRVQRHLDAVTQRYLAALESNTPSTPAPQWSYQAAESEDDENRIYQTGLVKKLVAAVERAWVVEQEDLVLADGQLHKPTFAKILKRYLDQWVAQAGDQKKPVAAAAAGSTTSPLKGATDFRSPLALARARRSAGSISHRRTTMAPAAANSPETTGKPWSPQSIQRFVRQIQSALDDTPLVTPEGTLDTVVLEQLLAHCMMGATQSETERSRAVASPTNSDAFQSILESDSSSIHRSNSQDRNQLLEHEGHTGQVKMPPSATLDADKLHRMQSADLNPHTPHFSEFRGPNGPASAIASSVSNKVTGLLKMFSRHDEKSELAAVAAFRKTQDHRKETDDASSMSSFRVLPDGIRKVVESMGSRNRPSPQSANVEGAGGINPEFLLDDIHEDYMVDTLDYEGSEHNDPAFSPERVKSFHQRVMRQSALIGDGDTDQSIIDTDGSDTSGAQMGADVAAQLLLSPTILTKRHQQALRAVESRSWDQVTYLLSANPWLAEMTDLTTQQYLLHKVAMYGAGDMGPESASSHSSPERMNMDLVRMFPSAVHKYDHEGNLPLHMAAASANLSMVRILGDRFPGGASVRNDDGRLPLHLAVLAAGSSTSSTRKPQVLIDTIKAILEYFPGAVAVADNEGNLPIHTAALTLRGSFGADIVTLMLDEGERQVLNPFGARFRNNKVKIDEDDMSHSTETTDSPTDSSNYDDEIRCVVVQNELGDTPLLAAIRARAGWEVIAALLSSPGGEKSVLVPDDRMNNALHLLVSEQYQDPAAAMKVLRVNPSAVSAINDQGMLPIEIACIQMCPRELILSFTLVDLPINMENDSLAETRRNLGGSWSYLTCECDDHFVDIVEEVARLCSYPQLRSLCLAKTPAKESIISRATPKCKDILQRALRIAGRFELASPNPIMVDEANGTRVFEGLDFGSISEPVPDGKSVLLEFYFQEATFLQRTAMVREFHFDFDLLERVEYFSTESSHAENDSADDSTPRMFLAFERPTLNLEGVVKGMLANEGCQADANVRLKYAIKVLSVLRSIAKALHALHNDRIVHGNVCLNTCCKFDDGRWKLTGILNAQIEGGFFDYSKFSISSPPESLTPEKFVAPNSVCFRRDLICHRTIDIWAFGKLAYEVLVGESLIEFDPNTNLEEDRRALLDILHWNGFSLDFVEQKLERIGTPSSCVKLILRCLSPVADQRPTMEEVLSDDMWSEMKR